MVILSVQPLIERVHGAKQTRNRFLLHYSPSGGVGVGVGAGVGVSAGVLSDMLLVVLLPVDSAWSRE